MFQHLDSSIVYRILAVASKPLVLIILTTYYDFKYAIYFSTYIILSQSLVHLFHSNLYRKFYEQAFNDTVSSYRILREFVRYIRVLKSSFLYFGILVTVILIGYLSMVAEESDLLWLSPLMLIGIFFDKIFSEQIRYQNFSGNSRQTSLIVLFGGGYVGVIFLVIGSGLSQLAMCLSVLGLLGIYIGYCRVFVFNKYQRSLLLWSLRNAKIYCLNDFFRLYKSKIYHSQITAVMSANLTNLDRHVYTLAYPAILPAMTFLSQIGSVLVLYVDLFKIFKDRPRYIKQDKLIFNPKEDLDLLVIGLIYCLGAQFVWYFLETFNMVANVNDSASAFFTMYMLVFPCYAMSRIGMEIIWWKSSDISLLYLETVCMLFYAVMLVAALLFWQGWMAVMLTTLGFSGIRLAYIITRSSESLVPKDGR